jgi:lipopolysaccharide/colanic/teichoic acid biosynthesis glycosyltransferase
MERANALDCAESVPHQQLAEAAQDFDCATASPFMLGDRGTEPLMPLGIGQRQTSAIDVRLLDVTVCTLLLILALPLMGVCLLAVLLGGETSPIFRHNRIGLDGREFKCLKFRTMRTDAHESLQEILQSSVEAQEQWLALQKLQQDPRVTPVGRFLRRYCLDELPQLFNVLVGDMSIVGPRPIVEAEIARYGSSFDDYCSVKPGLTGLWQVSGRHKLTYEERVGLDSEYARTKSVRADLAILWRTVPIVLFGLNE